jgi:hypothetical protein
MKKPVQTLRINRETLIRLDRAALEKIAGGISRNYTVCCTFGSCGQICP